MTDHIRSPGRRRFMLQSMAGVLALSGISLNNEVLAAVETAAKNLDSFKLPRVKLGSTSVRPSLMALGTGTSGAGYNSDQTRLGFDRLVNLMEYAYDRGIKFFDLADQYGSHPHMGKALKKGGGTIPRDDVVILTKINMDYNRGDDQVKYVHKILDKLRRQTNTEYFDIVLLHHMGIGSATGNWPKKFSAAMDTLSEEKQKGRIGALGISQHSRRYGDLEPLLLARDNPWVEVDLVRLNPWDGKLPGGWEVMDGTVDQVLPELRTMKNRGCGLIGMKVFNLTAAPSGDTFDGEMKQKGMSFAMKTPVLDCFTIGMDNRSQIDENLGLVAAVLEKKKID